MANLALVPCFFSVFFSLTRPRGSHKTGLRGISHVKASFLPFHPLNASAAHLAAHSARRPGRRKCLGLRVSTRKRCPGGPPRWRKTEEYSKRRQQKTHSSDRQAQGAPVRQMQDVVCSFFFFFFFLPLKTTSIINGLRTRFPRRPPGVNEWRIDGEFFVCQTEKMLQISVTQRCASLLPTGRGSYRHGPDRGLRLQELG